MVPSPANSYDPPPSVGLLSRSAGEHPGSLEARRPGAWAAAAHDRPGAPWAIETLDGLVVGSGSRRVVGRLEEAAGFLGLLKQALDASAEGLISLAASLQEGGAGPRVFLLDRLDEEVSLSHRCAPRPMPIVRNPGAKRATNSGIRYSVVGASRAGAASAVTSFTRPATIRHDLLGIGSQLIVPGRRPQDPSGLAPVARAGLTGASHPRP